MKLPNHIKMGLPDYKGGSIVNLMSSIARALESRTDYSQLKLLPPAEIKKAKNILLIVFDGLGFEYIQDKGDKSIFQKYLRGKMTSVFPSTTASAITTFATGEAPQQHAFTGWFTYLKETGSVSKILPFTPRAGGLPFTKYGFKIKEILDAGGFPSRLKTSCYTITEKEITASDFTRAMAKKSKILGYNSLDGFFKQIKKAVKYHNRGKYIFAYWPGFDSVGHKYGINSKKAERHFKKINKGIKRLIESLRGTNTLIIITSDHGLIDTTEKKVIWLEKHPLLKECLALPLCGEPRLAYCYVRPFKTNQFEKYIKTKFKRFCDIYKSEELVEKGYFGLFRANPRLKERIGDYTLIMKENYILIDRLLNEKESFLIGNHGGLSKEEMFVPLVVIKV